MTLYRDVLYCCGMRKIATSYRLREDVLEKLRVMAFLDSRSQTTMIEHLVSKEYELIRLQVDPGKLRVIEYEILGDEPLT